MIEDKLKKIIVECSEGIEINKINQDTDLVRDFGYNSMNIMQLIVEIESAFDIELDDDSLLLDKLSFYQGLIEIVEKKLGEKQNENYLS